MKINVKKLLFLAITLAIIGTVASLENVSSETATSVSEVDSKYVCMVTNKLFPNTQIPVEVADKTYYGCCEMCKAQLAENPSKRVATDPVSGNIVDKADAVIGAAQNGSVYYFENKANLDSFSKN